jgi:hypothetical protein
MFFAPASLALRELIQSQDCDPTFATMPYSAPTGTTRGALAEATKDVSNLLLTTGR